MGKKWLRRQILVTLGLGVSGSIAGCAEHSGTPGGSIIVENDDTEAHTVTATIVDGQPTRKERTTTVSPDDRHVWKEFIDNGGEFRVRISVEGYEPREENLTQPYDSSDGDHLVATITAEEVTVAVTSD